MSLRCSMANGFAGTISPPFGFCAKAVTPRSMSPTSAKIDRNDIHPEGSCRGLDDAELTDTGGQGRCPRRTPTWVTLGAICLSSSSHFALVVYSKFMNPVALPPGRAKVSTKPAPTGSPATGNTIGMVRVRLQNRAYRARAPSAKITSGASASNSAACLRRSRRGCFPAQRYSSCALRPISQPACCNPCLERADARLEFRIGNRLPEAANRCAARAPGASAASGQRSRCAAKNT